MNIILHTSNADDRYTDTVHIDNIAIIRKSDHHKLKTLVVLRNETLFEGWGMLSSLYVREHVDEINKMIENAKFNNKFEENLK